MKPRPTPLLVLLLALAGCAAPAALDPAGRQADEISRLWWTFLWAGAAVYVVVLIALVVAAVRGSRRAKRRPRASADTDPDAGAERRTGAVVVGSVALTTVILLALLLVDGAAGRRLRALSDDTPLTITITGHQWWWEVKYEDSLPSRAVTTANELVLPLGRPVRLYLQSSDVIHSFWVPALGGKKDLIPGHPAVHWLRADRPGTYRGRCAEYCGLQHAHMGFTVTVVPPLDFYAWLDAARLPAREPETESEARGRAVFESGPCALCHTIAGTEARGTVGPDLTHLASRATLAAGTLPNARATIAGWVANPAHAKPGVLMPPVVLPPADLRALTDYLASLR